MTPRVVEVREKILKKNDELARAMRADFGRSGVYVANLVSSPGSGKTELLSSTLSRLITEYDVAAVVGDLATDNDARRLAASGRRRGKSLRKPSAISKPTWCATALQGWDLAALDFLFIENVGNLVCPSSWDLGEDLRVLLFPVTEGEDKPLKYPTLINTADVVVISKMDLAAAVGFDMELASATFSRFARGSKSSKRRPKPGKESRSGSNTWAKSTTQTGARRAGSASHCGKRTGRGESVRNDLEHDFNVRCRHSGSNSSQRGEVIARILN